VLQASGVAAAAVANVRDIVEHDPQLADYVEYVTQPMRPDLRIPVPGEAIQPAGRIRPLRAAPVYGGDNDYVLRQLLQLSDAEVIDLHESGVIS
jgi:crotonobetainyl-CoA:carnitine CoA-transferase CaiB-like acyl-CoA transferase